MLVDLVSLSIVNNGFGRSVNYEVVKDYCKTMNLDSLTYLRKVKNVVAQLA